MNINVLKAKPAPGDFLPDLCVVQVVFALILVGELLAFSFVVIAQGVQGFTWPYFGAISFLVQWVILSSTAILCPLRPWFRRQNGIISGTVSYTIVLVMTAIFSALGDMVLNQVVRVNWEVISSNLVVAGVFAGVVLRYCYLQQQLMNKEQSELKSRVEALQSRIKPHFLFNSMNSIASLIDIDPQAAEKMVVDLSGLFRASLSDAGMVSLKDELSLCEGFVSIEQIRLGDRLAVKWHVNVEDLNLQVPNLILQPVIENAIYHGGEMHSKGGCVDVFIEGDEKLLTLKVVNPILLERNDGRVQKGNGMALDNIRHRLLAYYGEKATLSLTHDEHAFSALIEIPYGEKDTRLNNNNDAEQ